MKRLLLAASAMALIAGASLPTIPQAVAAAGDLQASGPQSQWVFSYGPHGKPRFERIPAR